MKKSRKKCIAVLLALIMVFGGAGTVFADDEAGTMFTGGGEGTVFAEAGAVTVTVGTASAVKGAKGVEVPVTITNNPGIASAVLEFNFPEELTLITFEGNGGMSFGSEDFTTGSGVGFITMEEDAGYTEKLLTTLVFAVSGNATDGLKEITINTENENVSLGNVEGTGDITFTSVNGGIDVTLPELTGTASISGTAKYDETLTASLSGVNAPTTGLHYQWSVGNESNGESSSDQNTYKINTASAIGQTISVSITAEGYSGSKKATSAVVEKADKPETLQALATSELMVGTTSIAVTAQSGDEREYGLSAADTNQPDMTAAAVFNGLTPSTIYKIYQRVKVDTQTRNAADWSAAVQVKTAEAQLTGTVTISGEAIFGVTLSAIVEDSNAESFVYQWYRDTDKIEGATGENYTLAAEDVGKTIKVEVSANGYGGTRASAATAAVEKAAAPTPAAPVVTSKTNTSVTLKAQEGYEYAIGDQSEITTTGVFANLSPNQAYTFYQRQSQSATHFASAWSDSVTITTNEMSGSVSLEGEFRFGQTLTAEAIDLPDGQWALRYQWLRGSDVISGATGAAYTLTIDDIGKMITAKVTIDGKTDEFMSTTPIISKAAGPGAPSAPTLASKTTNAVKLNTAEGNEYRLGEDGTPNTTGEFTGLSASTAYSFYQRVKETQTAEASAWSAALNVTTDQASGSSSSSGGSGGGGGGGGSASTTVNASAGEGSVSLSGKQSGGSVTLSIPDAKITEIISKAKDNTANIDISKANGATETIIPTEALTKFADAGLGVETVLPTGTITLDKAAVASAIEQAGGTNLSVSLKQLKASDIPEAQRNVVKDNDLIVDVNVVSSTKKITDFDGGNITITLAYNGSQPVAVWYLSDEGKMEKINCRYDENAKTVTFTTNHLSKYLIGVEDGTRESGGTEEAMTPVTPAMPANPFTDVQGSDWYIDHVIYAYDNGLMNGTSKNPMLFSPKLPMTRAMVATVLYHAKGSPEVSGIANPFQDIPAGAWYTDAVKWAAENKIMSGVGNGTFLPDTQITREQTAVTLENYMRHANIDLLVTDEYIIFADEANIASYAKNSMQTLNKLGIINGKGDAVIDPKGRTTRAEFAAMLHNFMDSAGNSGE